MLTEGRNMKRKTAPNHWSKEATKKRTGFDLEQGVFALKNSKEIALSLSRSAKARSKEKHEQCRWALSVLVFYVNRAGQNLSPRQKKTLLRAKLDLKKLYGMSVE